MTEIVAKQLSYAVNGCIFDVHNEVGPGLREECYQKAMEIRLTEKGIPYVAKPRTRGELVHQGVCVDAFEPDLLVDEQLVLELKAQREGFAQANFTQILTYLKFWNRPLGLLVNFALSKAIIERLPYQPRRAEPEEDCDHIRDRLMPDVRDALRKTRDSLLAVYEQYGLGYPATTCCKLVKLEMQSRGLKCQSELVMSPEFHDRELPHSPITPILVEDCVLVEVEAIHDDITARQSARCRRTCV